MSKTRNIIYVDPELLDFDRENPRLVEFGKVGDEQQILNLLWREMAIEELVMSILAQGFFPHEPVYVVEKNGHYTVVEGNRRLAAIKSILHPERVANNRMEKFMEQVPAAKEILRTEGVPVLVMKNREEAWRYIGFKHVNGAAKWGSFAKAKYIAKVHREYNVPLDKIAEQIGDGNQTVVKLYEGLMVLEQAEQKAEFSISDVQAGRLYFSHLYTALAYQKFRSYIGLADDGEPDIPENKVENLQEAMDWLFGSKKRGVEQKVKSQNPDLKRLVKILDNDMSVAALRAGQSLDVAVDLSIKEEDAFRDAILKAKLAIERAAAKLSGYKGDEVLLQQMDGIAEMADSLYEQMRSIKIKMNGRGRRQRHEEDSEE